MKRRILLVDDELAILLTLRAILEMNGFEVDTAASAREAETKLVGGDYHMVITDMRMETETAGYDVIRVAKQQRYNPAVAILTAYPSLGSDWKTRGAESMLVKPMNANDLLRQIEALLIVHEDHKQKADKTPLKVATASKSGDTPSTRAKRVG
jgi:DNA-binding response OmpR family regulator